MITDGELLEESEDEEFANVYTLNRGYAITINPDDKNQNWSAIKEDRILLSRQRMMDIMSDPPKGFYYELYTEISESSSGVRGNGMTRVHYHGTIMFKTKSALMWWLLVKWNSFTTWTSIMCKPIVDNDRWHNYCVKQMWLIQRVPISNTHNSLLNGKDYELIMKEHTTVPENIKVPTKSERVKRDSCLQKR